MMITGKIPLHFDVVEADTVALVVPRMFRLHRLDSESVRNERMDRFANLIFLTILVRYFLPDSKIFVNSCGESKQVNYLQLHSILGSCCYIIFLNLMVCSTYS